MLRDERHASPDAVEAVLATRRGGAGDRSSHAHGRWRPRAAEDPDTFADLATAFCPGRHTCATRHLGARAAEALGRGVVRAARCSAATDVAAGARARTRWPPTTIAAALAALAALRAPIDGVLRGGAGHGRRRRPAHERACSLLNRFAAVFKDVADFSKMAKNR